MIILLSAVAFVAFLTGLYIGIGAYITAFIMLGSIAFVWCALFRIEFSIFFPAWIGIFILQAVLQNTYPQWDHKYQSCAIQGGETLKIEGKETSIN